MPKQDGHGFSKWTHFKQWKFSEIFAWHMKVAYRAVEKAPPWKKQRVYHYIDLTSGKGYMPRQPWLAGSPIIAAGILAGEGKDYRIHLYERDPQNAESLAASLDILRQRNVALDAALIDMHAMPYEIGLPVLAEMMKACRHEARVGLIYYDPNAFGSDADVEAYTDLIQVCSGSDFRYIDVLLRLPGTCVKRVAKAFDRPSLMHYIELFPKNFKYISKPVSAHQFSFFYLTNDEKNRPPKLLESVDSLTGSSWVRVISETKQELRTKGQMTLFD